MKHVQNNKNCVVFMEFLEVNSNISTFWKQNECLYSLDVKLLFDFGMLFTPRMVTKRDLFNPTTKKLR